VSLHDGRSQILLLQRHGMALLQLDACVHQSSDACIRCAVKWMALGVSTACFFPRLYVADALLVTASQEVMLALVGIYNTTKTENVKATTASTLSRLLRSSPALLPALLDRWGPHILLKGVSALDKCLAQMQLFAHSSWQAAHHQ